MIRKVDPGVYVQHGSCISIRLWVLDAPEASSLAVQAQPHDDCWVLRSQLPRGKNITVHFNVLKNSAFLVCHPIVSR
jgi:hypothetical protein